MKEAKINAQVNTKSENRMTYVVRGQGLIMTYAVVSHFPSEKIIPSNIQGRIL
jgi:hypothetical protein